MLHVLLNVTLVILAECPAVYIIDCSNWNGGAGIGGRFTVVLRFTCCDGTVLADEIGGDRAVSISTVIECLATSLQGNGWQFDRIGQPGAETTIVVRGSKLSPIKGATFQGNVWVPSVQRRIVGPPVFEPKK